MIFAQRTKLSCCAGQTQGSVAQVFPVKVRKPSASLRPRGHFVPPPRLSTAVVENVNNRLDANPTLRPLPSSGVPSRRPLHAPIRTWKNISRYSQRSFSLYVAFHNTGPLASVATSAWCGYQALQDTLQCAQKPQPSKSTEVPVSMRISGKTAAISIPSSLTSFFSSR